jgi:hypothetical protein|tara:strand:+ start:186 stop:500 length:315 start_codon:yes stop_codon:yes gene_type:complete
MDKPKFVEEKDILVLKELGINYENDINIFLKELRCYFNEVWREEEHIENEITSLDELNSKYLEEYPSTGGYYVLEGSFTGSCPTEILSSKSKIILSYLYNISLR